MALVGAFVGEFRTKKKNSGGERPRGDATTETLSETRTNQGSTIYQPLVGNYIGLNPSTLYSLPCLLCWKLGRL